MKHFLRAILLSLRYKWSITGAIICSLLVALLWSGSITTIFPVVECVFREKTFSQLVQDGTDEAIAKRDSLQAEIQQLSKSLATANPTESVDLEYQIKHNSRLIADLEQTIAWYQWVQPYVDRYAPKDPFATLVAAMSFLTIATLLKGVFLVLSSIFVARVAQRTVMDMRRIYYRKALELDQIRIDRLGTSNLMTQLSHNMLMVSGGLIMFYGKAIREPLKMLTCMIVAAWICWPLLLISLFVVPLGAIVIQQVARSMKRATQREIEGMADIFDTLIETFSAIKTVRIFNQERSERRRFKRNAATLYRMAVRMRFFDSLLRPISEMLGIISIAVSILAGAYLVLTGSHSILGIPITNRDMNPGELMLFYGMLAGASDPARKMSEIFNVLVRGGIACENLNRTYQIECKVIAPKNPVPVPQHSREVNFQNVSFRYTAKQPVLNQINLKIPFGQTLAIVGENGCGKSTLMNLLARLYDPNGGKILIDGVDIRLTNPKKLRRQIAWVTQDSTLFQGTVWDNIAYGKRNPTDEEILEAAKLAQVDSLIGDLSKGYQTQVGESGFHLSAGQRQRVILARAILADPRIFVLDEATSQMDGHTESLVHEALRPFIKSRTTIIITHRYSSLKLVDRIIVMRQGKIVSDLAPDQAIHSSQPFQHLFSKSA